MKEQTKILALRILNKEITMLSFEEELYKIKENNLLLEELILIDFKTKYVYHEVEKVIHKHLSSSEIETYKINAILNDIKDNNENSFNSFLRTYDLRCKGYWFLEELGMYMALNVISSRDSPITDITNLSDKVRNEYLQVILPKAKIEANRIQELLISKQIILTGETRGPYNQKCWIDNRNEDSIEKKELETIKFHSQSTYRIRETRDKWLQGGPLFEISSIKTNYESKRILIERELKHLKTWIPEFQIVTDDRTYKEQIENFITGTIDEEIVCRSMSINCRIELSGIRKAAFEIIELSKELYSTNLYMYGSRISANEWNEIGVSEHQKNEIIHLANKYIEISKPIVLTIAYEDDCISLFDTEITYPNAEFKLSNLKIDQIAKYVKAKQNGYEFCYIRGDIFNIKEDLEIRKTET